MGADENTAIPLRAMPRFDAGDLDGYFELYDPSLRLHDLITLLVQLDAIEPPGS